MTFKPFLVDSSLYDLSRPIATLEDIRRFNSQRFEMERLTAIVYENMEEAKACVGYNDLPEDDFWVRGHMPGRPILPGILICEAAAQLASYFVTKHRMFDNAIMGFAGLEDVKFRGMVKPGDRLVLQCALLKTRKILVTARFMAIVNNNIVCEGILKGVPLPLE